MTMLSRLRDGSWDAALMQVTGYYSDLRGLCDGNAMIAPSVIMLQKDPHAGSWLLMHENTGQPAIDRLVHKLNELSKIMPQIQEGQHGLMDIASFHNSVWTAERNAGFLTGLKARTGQLAADTSSSASGEDGMYRRRLASELNLLHAKAAAKSDVTDPEGRTVPALLVDAREALASFGRRMAEAFYAAEPELTQIATTFWDGANTNLRNYWQANGWGPEGPNSRLLRDAPDDAEVRWRAAMANYSSAGLPGLPAGTPTVTGDLMDDWWAFGAALTQRLSNILDTMDDTAADALGVLERAYRAAAHALSLERMLAVPGETLVPGRPMEPLTPLIPQQHTPLVPAQKLLAVEP